MYSHERVGNDERFPEYEDNVDAQWYIVSGPNDGCSGKRYSIDLAKEIAGAMDVAYEEGYTAGHNFTADKNLEALFSILKLLAIGRSKDLQDILLQEIAAELSYREIHGLRIPELYQRMKDADERSRKETPSQTIERLSNQWKKEDEGKA